MSLAKLFLFKRSNGLWYILYEENGRRRWKSTGCILKSDALEKLTEFKNLIKEKPKSKTLLQFKEEFLSYARSAFAQGTVDIYVVCIRNLLNIAGHCLLSSLTPHHIDRYKVDRLKTVKPVTVNVELRALRTMLNIALRIP